MATENYFHLTISNVGEQLFKGDAFSVTVPGASGEMTLLPHHEPFITLLKEGDIRIKHDEAGEKVMHVSGGLLETSNNQIIILV